MSKLLQLALAEKRELEHRLNKINKMIDLLGGNAKKKKHTAATRRKMKLAWARRKAAKIQVAAGGQDDE